MHVVHDGSRQAPPLPLVHGSGASWAPMVPTLAARHHVLRVDLPGSGQSPPVPSFDVAAQAGRVAAPLDGLGLRRVAVAGHSSGGCLATALAERHPDLVGSSALISTGPSLGALLPQPLILRLLLAPPFGPLLWARRSDATVRRSLLATAARPVDVPEDMVADLRRLSYRTFRTAARGDTAHLAERSDPSGSPPWTCRYCAVFGAADPRWDPASARDYAAVPGVRVETLPGVGHLPPLEAPGATREPWPAIGDVAWPAY